MKDPLRDTPVVVASELPNNSGTSVASTVEQLAAEIADVQGFAFGRILVFIEHISPEAMVWMGARRHSTWSGEERDVGVEVTDELLLIAERK